MSDLSSRPRQTPMAGHRKATSSWCARCERLHRTHRHADGYEPCPLEHEPRARGAEPHVFAIPKLKPRRENPFNRANWPK